ncbi:MAG: leucine dehydrogenase [Planctomycetota bacterium]|nr:leucine dehydrogenase [Planctomycetota bacterium]
MSIHVLDAMSREGFEELHALHDRRSGLRAFLGIHDTTRGPAFGGIRRWKYRDERSALSDCLRLSRAMTHKCALADLSAGGAKLVILDGGDEDWEAAYRHIGRVVERMAGRFYTGPDVGTGPIELSWLSQETAFATDPGPAGPGLLAESTAEGVFRGIEASLEHLDGEVDWPARRMVIQGLGAVGANLARRLVEQGATVLAADLDEELARRVCEELGLERLDPTRVISSPCDVFSPCALGGILHDVTLGRLDCRVVAGGANNVLAKSLHGDLLHERGILVPPDFVLNCGALIRGTIFHLEGRRESVEAIGLRIKGVLEQVLTRSQDEDAPPARVAVREAEERIAAWRDA